MEVRLPTEAIRNVIGYTMADVGGEARGLSRTINDGKQRYKIDVIRTASGGYSFVFTAVR